MTVRVMLSLAAIEDLRSLERYLRPLSPQGHRNVVRAIQGCLRRLRDFPMLGQVEPGSTIRRIVEPKYGYLIPYVITGRSVHILLVYRAVRSPLDYEDDTGEAT